MHDDQQQQQRGILYHIQDLPNGITLGNVALGFLALALIHGRHFELAIVLLGWTIFFDHLDGHLARKQTVKDAAKRTFGAQLDSFSDLINFGLVPAFLTLAISDGSALGAVSALLLVLASVLRLGYFNMYGLRNGAFFGVPTTICAFFFVVFLFFATRFGDHAAAILPLFVIFMAILEVAPVRVPKPSYRIEFVLIAAVALSVAVSATTEGLIP
jgi:CDP-diacylglycerol--serine O-phosphatidyltransferase